MAGDVGAVPGGGAVDVEALGLGEAVGVVAVVTPVLEGGVHVERHLLGGRRVAGMLQLGRTSAKD